MCLILSSSLRAKRAEPTPSPTPVLYAVKGQLRELGGKDPIEGATIRSLGAQALSQVDGSYALELVPGWHLLSYEHPDYQARERAVTLTAQAQDLGLVSLRRSSFRGQEVTVRAKRDDAPSRVSIQREEIRKIAGVGRDPLRALQTLPGVVSPGDFSGLLAVRGGGPQDNLYYLNDIPYPVPFHYGGAISTVHTDLLESVDLYAAAFPARWGGVDGAILDAKSRGPKMDRLHGQVDLNLLLGEALLEGPLWKSQGTSGSWLISGRRSYFDLLLSRLGDTFTAVPRFWDMAAMTEFKLGSRDTVRVLGIASDDILGLELKPDDVRSKDFAGEFRLQNTYGSAGFNWAHQGEGWRSVFTPFVYQNAVETNFGSKYFIRVKPTVGGFREELRFELGANELRLGGGAQATQFEAKGFAFRRRTGQGSGVQTFSDPAGLTITAYTMDGFGFIEDRLKLGPNFSATAGLRYQKSERMGGDALDPRVGLEWKAARGTRLTAGWGLFHQLPNGQELSSDFGNPGLDFSLTEHVVAGVEQALGPATSIKVEAYNKAYRQRVVQVADANDPRIYSNDGQGNAAGLELMLRHAVSQRFFGWISYSYAKTQRLDQPFLGWRDYQYDQPHTLTLVGSYDLKPNWSAGLKLNYHTGPLITPMAGRVVSTDPNNLTGWDPVYGQPYSQRLPDYLRLDLRTDYSWLFEGMKLSLYAEIINVLAQKNPSGVTYKRDLSDFASPQTVNGLPLLPYLGLSLEF